jgi:hypothetical protein
MISNRALRICRTVQMSLAWDYTPSLEYVIQESKLHLRTIRSPWVGTKKTLRKDAARAIDVAIGASEYGAASLRVPNGWYRTIEVPIPYAPMWVMPSSIGIDETDQQHIERHGWTRITTALDGILLRSKDSDYHSKLPEGSTIQTTRRSDISKEGRELGKSICFEGTNVLEEERLARWPKASARLIEEIRETGNEHIKSAEAFHDAVRVMTPWFANAAYAWMNVWIRVVSEFQETKKRAGYK